MTPSILTRGKGDELPDAPPPTSSAPATLVPPEEVFPLHARYHALQDLALNEDRLFSERSQMFILGSTILVTAFALFKDGESLRIPVSVAGLALCAFWMYVNAQAGMAVRFWRASLHELELKYLGGEDFGIYVARARFWAGGPGPQPAVPDIDGALPPSGIGRWMICLPANKIIILTTPGIFLILWAVLLTEALGPGLSI